MNDSIAIILGIYHRRSTITATDSVVK